MPIEAEWLAVGKFGRFRLCDEAIKKGPVMNRAFSFA
jgi:hypothetical protein